MKKWLILFLSIFISFMSIAYAGSPGCNVTVDGYGICRQDINDYYGLPSSPSISLLGQGRMYFDAGLGKFMCSENGGSFVNCIGSGSGGSGTVTSVSVASANGFSGTVATSTTTPAITIQTSVNGIMKGNGTAASVATAGTDYVIPSGNVATSTTAPTTAVLATGTVTGATSQAQIFTDGVTSNGPLVGPGGGNANYQKIVCGGSNTAGTAVPTGTTNAATVIAGGSIIKSSLNGSLSEGVCSAQIDIWAAAAGTWPTVTNTITASDLPAISSANEADDTTLSGWTTAVTAGERVKCNIVSNTCDQLTETLWIKT